jgi:nitroreductase
MDFLQVVERRRAVRQFRSTPLERSLIERLINTAVLAPSAMNLQPWAFAVVTGVTRIDEYARRAKEYLIAEPGAQQLPPQADDMLKDPQFNIFYHAPVLLMVLAKSDEAQAREDCCLAAQTLMLAARDAGVGTCWIGFGRPWLDLAETKSELGIAQTYHVVAPIVMGHPTAWPESHGRHAAEIHWAAS